MRQRAQTPARSAGTFGAVYLPCAVVYAILALACIYLSRRPGNVATLWFANAWLTACLLQAPLRRWPGLALAAMSGNLVANLIIGDPLALSVTFLPANLLESLFGASLLRRIGTWPTFDRSPSAMLCLLLLGGVLPPALGALLGAGTIALYGFAPFSQVWPSWFAGSAIGSCSFLPLALLLLRDKPALGTLFSQASLTLVVMAILLDVLALHWLPFPFIYIMMPLILAAALYGTVGAVLPVFAGTATSGVMIALGYFVPPPFTAPWEVLLTYIPLLLTIIPPLALGAITQQSRDRERAMRLSEDQFRGAFQTAAHGIALVSLEGRWLMVNPALCHIVGYTAQALLRTDFQTITHPDDLTADLSYVRELIAGKIATYQLEKRYIHKDGHPVWVLLSVSLVRDEQGRPMHFVSQVQDISELRHNAATLTELNSRLSAEVALSEQRRGEIEAMFTLAPGALLVVNEAGQIVRANESAHEMFQFPDGSLHGELIETLIPVDERSNHVQMRKAFIADLAARPRFMNPNRDFAAQRRDGSQFPAEVAIGPIPVEGKRGAIAFVLDISEQRRHQVALEEAKQVAEAASRAKSDFVANMSHEIRTPMNAILGMLQLLQQTELTLRQADYVDKTDSASRALLGILDDILDFSKIEAGKLMLDSHHFHVDRMMRSIGIILSANVGKKELEILFDIDPQLPKVLRGDSLRLQQILINLAGNAIKFTEHGEVILAIRMLKREGKQLALHFSVRDTGIGIAPEQRAHIFEGFSQAEASTSRRFGGTGLGLAISQRLVHMMGGELALDSELGVGSTFYFTLDLEAAADQPDPAQMGNASMHGLRALIVDDNASAREVIASMVSSLGWRADLAASGPAALQRLQESIQAAQPYEVIFIDWRMPEMDGWETSLRIRQMELSGRSPLIVMVTVYGREMLAQKLTEEQALLDGFLVKPITSSMLFDAVADARASHGRIVPPLRSKPVSQQRLAGMRLLVVEDNQTNQQVAKELLSNEGALVEVANGGLAGVEAVQNAARPFDGVLMDIQMPDMDGYAATREIRGRLGQRELPIIAMTANAMASDRAACLAAGMNDHVGKPFDITQLVAVIRQHAGRSADANQTAAPRPGAIPAALLQQALQAGIDAATALDRFGDNLPIYRNALRSYLDETQTILGQLREFAVPEQRSSLARTLHTLKGVAATIGANRLLEQVRQAEAQVRDVDDPRPLPDLVAAIQLIVEQSLPIVAELITQSAGPVSPPAAVPLAPDVLRNKLEHLADLLQATNLGALSAYAELRANLAQRWPEESATLGQRIEQLDFQGALTGCRTVLQNLDMPVS